MALPPLLNLGRGNQGSFLKHMPGLHRTRDSDFIAWVWDHRTLILLIPQVMLTSYKVENHRIKRPGCGVLQRKREPLIITKSQCLTPCLAQADAQSKFANKRFHARWADPLPGGETVMKSLSLLTDRLDSNSAISSARQVEPQSPHL